MTSANQVRGVWMNKNTGAKGSQWVFCQGAIGQPVLTELNAVFADADGDIYLQASQGLKLVSGVIDQQSGLLVSWKGDTTSRGYVGVTGIDDHGVKKIVTLSSSGWLYLFSTDFQKVDSVQVSNSADQIFWLIKSDGKLDANGIATLWIETVKTDIVPSTYGLTRIDFDPQSMAYQSHFYPLRSLPGANAPLGQNPFKAWNDFTPFWVGPQDLRIVALVDDYIQVFSDQGVWVGGAWGTTYPDENTIVPSGPLYLARSISTANNRTNWQNLQDILVGDDFRQQGHGLQRLTWTPDGFEDYLALKVTLREAAGKSDPMSKPIIKIYNLSGTRQLDNFKLRLWYSRQEIYPSVVKSDPYWFWVDSTTLATGCQLDNPNLCWTDVIFNPNNTFIDPGDSSANDGIQLGIHSADWQGWDRTNDFSWNGMDSTNQTDTNLTIYQSGITPGTWVKVWGNEPASSSVPIPSGWHAGPPPVDASAQSVMSFDDTAAWGVTPGTISLNTQSHEEGSASIQLIGSGWNQLQSIPFSWGSNFSNVTLAIEQPATLVNPYWTGQVQVYMESRTFGIYNQWIGQVDLTPLPKGNWTDVSFVVPAWIISNITGAIPDLVFRIVLNTPQLSSGYSVDNLRLQ